LFKSLTFFCVLFLAGPGTRAEEAASSKALGPLVEAEKNFARTALIHGIREAFLQFLASNSLVFNPSPMNGRTLYEKYDDKGRRLIWEPIFATISSSEELGITTGPWELKKSATDRDSIAFGQFVSVWEQQPDNSWKVILDVGIDHPPPKTPAPKIQLLPAQGTVPDAEATAPRPSLDRTEERFLEALKVDAGAAILASAGDDVRILRQDSFPAVGKSAAKLMLASDHAKMVRSIFGGHVSASGDLAYRYGSYSSQHENVNERGYFLSIWKINSKRDWNLLLDLQKASEK
jgi:ketosteroid isomerase-like protein